MATLCVAEEAAVAIISVSVVHEILVFVPPDTQSSILDSQLFLLEGLFGGQVCQSTHWYHEPPLLPSPLPSLTVSSPKLHSTPSSPFNLSLPISFHLANPLPTKPTHKSIAELT